MTRKANISPLQRIKVFCLRCALRKGFAVLDCPEDECELYPLRYGKREGSNNLSDEGRDRLREMGRRLAERRKG